MAAASGAIGAKLDWARRVCETAAANHDRLNDYEATFARNLAGNLARHGADAYLSAKEMGVAKRIGRKLEVAL